MLILEKERNLALEESLAKEKDKVEKLAMDLSLAKDSNLRMSKDHALANDSLANLKNANSELQERDKTKNMLQVWCKGSLHSGLSSKRE